MSLSRSFSPVRLALALSAAAAAMLLGACAHSGGSGGNAGTASRSSVEVFGVIDAGVSHSTSKSERR